MKLISAALVKAQKAFSPALKTSTNPHFKSKYADLSACVEAVIDALNANGIFLMQQSSESPDGVVIETTFIHESGEQLSSGKLFVPAAKKDAQGFGSAVTYARRYSLMAACGIAPEDDDGNAASKQQKPATAVQGLTPNTVADFLAGITEASNIDALKATFARAYKAAGAVSDTSAQHQFKTAYDKQLATLAENTPEIPV